MTIDEVHTVSVWRVHTASNRLVALVTVHVSLLDTIDIIPTLFLLLPYLHPHPSRDLSVKL